MGFQITREEEIYQGRVFQLVRASFRLNAGSEHTFDLIKHRGAVVIIPVDEQGNILFVRQFRIGAAQELLELPAGLLEEGEQAGESARREIREETGMAPHKMMKLGEFYMVPGYSTEKMQVFLATGLYESRLPTDADEQLELVPIPIAQAYQLAQSGELADGKTLAALFLAMPLIFPLSQGAGAKQSG